MPDWASGFKHVTSVCEQCQRPFTRRHQSAHHDGIVLQDAWYCSAPCFTAAVEKAMKQLLAEGSEPIHRAERMPLGLFLVSRGLLTKEQLREATQEQKERGGEMGDLLVRRGVVSEKQVAAAKATQWGCPLFALPSQGVRVTLRFPPPLEPVYTAVPLHFGGPNKQLLVGFVHGVEYGLLYAVEHIMGCKTEACMVTPSDYDLQRKLHGVTDVPGLLTFEAVAPVGEMARSLCKAALEMEAHEALIAKCKGYLWARVKREGEHADVLFKTQ